MQQLEVVLLGGAAAGAEEVAEEPLELLPEDAVDDEVDGGVHGDEEVGDLGQLGDLDSHQLERRLN